MARVSVSARTRLLRVLLYRDIRIACGAFLLAQLLDSLTTLVALGTGRFHEANPWVAGALTEHPLAAYLGKMVMAVAVTVTLLLLRLRWRLRLAVLVLLALASLIAPATNALRLANVL